MIATQSPSANPATAALAVIDARDVPNQRMHDASRFPLVRLRRRAVQPGYAFTWGAEMRRLSALKAPFVIVSEYCADETATTRACAAPGCARTATLSRCFVVVLS